MTDRELQVYLIEVGYGDIVGQLDGIKGKKTIAAVKEFQRDHQLVVDGIPGKKTQAMLYKVRKYAGVNGTRNFGIHEFRSPDDKSLPIGGMDSRLLLKLEWLRWKLGNKPVVVNSGYRTVAYNKKVGGIANSNHLKGNAADIKVIGVSAQKVQEVAMSIFEGVGKYQNFTHVDTDKKAIKFIGKY